MRAASAGSRTTPSPTNGSRSPPARAIRTPPANATKSPAISTLKRSPPRAMRCKTSRPSRSLTRRSTRRPRRRGKRRRSGKHRPRRNNSIGETARSGDGENAPLAQHVRDKTLRAEQLRKRAVAYVEAARIGTERRHHQALVVAGKTAPAHGAAAAGHARHRMQMAGDFAGMRLVGRLVAKCAWTERQRRDESTADVFGRIGIVVAGDPDPVDRK